MSLFGGKSRQLVGLDIGSSSIKAVELKATKGGYELVSFGTEHLAQDTVVDGRSWMRRKLPTPSAKFSTRSGLRQRTWQRRFPDIP